MHANNKHALKDKFVCSIFLEFVHSYLERVVIFSVTRRRRDIKIPLCLSAPVLKSLI